MLTLKLQYDTFETGEFTEEYTVDTNSILEIFEEHTKIIKTKLSYTISKPYVKFFLKNGENYLLVMHFAKDAFPIEYCNELDDKLYSGNFYKNSVKTILELFSNKSFDALNKAIPRTKKNGLSLIRCFKREDFTYNYKYGGLAWLIIHTVLTFPFIVIIVAFGLKYSFNFAFFFISIIMSFFPISVVMHFFLNYNYVKKSKGITIKISSGSSKITINHFNYLYEFEKSEIKEIKIYEAAGLRNPFNGYSFSRIVLNDNRAFNITNMIIEPYELEYKLRGIECKTLRKFYPYI